jgi:hypothetical protein
LEERDDVSRFYDDGATGKITMALHTVFRVTKEEGDLGYGVIKVLGQKYPVRRTSPLYGDMGYGVVKVFEKTYPVYRTKKEHGDIGLGVVNIQFK